MRAKVLRDPLVQYSRGLNWYSNIDELAVLARGGAVLKHQSKLFANHSAPEQLTNHNTFSFSEGGPSSNPELIELFVSGWGERYCNNVNYMKNNAIFEPPNMRACSSTPPKQNQDFIKEHNRTTLKLEYLIISLFWLNKRVLSKAFKNLTGFWTSSLYILKNQ